MFARRYADGVSSAYDQVDRIAEHWAEAGMEQAAIARLALSKRVSRLAMLIEQRLKAALADVGLTYAEFDVLATLRRSGAGLRPGELSKALMLTSGGMSNVLRRLTDAGFVDRKASDVDARGSWVHLTPAGDAVTDKALAASTRVHDDLLAGIPDTTIRTAADALREITAVTDHRR